MNLSESLHGEPVGLMPVDERYRSIRFGLLDGYANLTLHTPIFVFSMRPVVQ